MTTSTDGAVTMRPPPGPRRILRDVLELDQADGLAEHGPAGAVPLEQLGLRPEHDPLGPADRGDVRDDPVGHRGGQLAAIALPLAMRSVGDVGATHRQG